MSIVVRDSGFSADDWPEKPQENNVLKVIDLPGDTAPEDLDADIFYASHIRILIPGFADGRGFTLAKQLRAKGFSGRLRASGPIIADQYAMARRSGFDEVEIPATLAERQPEEDWLARADWNTPHYQARLRG
ncbi:MAG: DUF934 domain-containing protein [Natronohydrobacter sp.]|nr:DUF934 domain-containing protein [Natronohydrobacter sp.]